MSVPDLGAIVPNLGKIVLYVVLLILLLQGLYTIWENRK